MTPPEYLDRVRAVTSRASAYLPPAQLEEVNRLIEHGEPAEGLCSLAWAIVNSQVLVPGDVIEAIYDYTGDLIDAEQMPADLRDFVG